jgi:hypothetical protein
MQIITRCQAHQPVYPTVISALSHAINTNRNLGSLIPIDFEVLVALITLQEKGYCPPSKA